MGAGVNQMIQANFGPGGRPGVFCSFLLPSTLLRCAGVEKNTEANFGPGGRLESLYNNSRAVVDEVPWLRERETCTQMFRVYTRRIVSIAQSAVSQRSVSGTFSGGIIWENAIQR